MIIDRRTSTGSFDVILLMEKCEVRFDVDYVHVLSYYGQKALRNGT